MNPEQIEAEIAAEAEVLRTPCGDGHLVWRRWGAGSPLVLLHGGYGTWRHWLRNVRGLARSFAVLVPDMPGFGDSATPPEPHTPTALAGFLAVGLDQLLGPDATFDLVGFSFGGTVAGELALVRPQNVRRLVIVGTSNLAPPNPDRPEPVKWRTAADPIDVHRENLERLMIADPARVDDLAIHIQTVNTARARIASRRFRGQHLLTQALKQLSVPRAGIWGGKDALGGHGLDVIASEIRGTDPTTPFEVIPGTGHWVPYEQPESFNASLLKILRLEARPNA
jgi:pimeloyl-ACP methyl ester carboxylesterase